MHEPTNCLHCRSPLLPDSPKGLCPRCLLAIALQEGSAEDARESPGKLGTAADVEGKLVLGIPAHPMDLITHTAAPSAGETSIPDVGPMVPALDAQAAPRPLTDGAGTQIGPYKLLQEIGQGGMGVVYLAEQEKPVRRRVALKVIKAGMDSDTVVARFEAERQALAIMDHPGIAKIFDAGATESGRPYFVMELINGVPITEYCDRNYLTLRQRLELFVPVCQAIQHAHQKGIIHRDIKPSNVLVTLNDGTPVPKVIDFGIAKAIAQRLTEQTMFTQLGAVVGTLEYMSPEQAEMSGLDIDTGSDIYSLGVMLYELLTGTTPLVRTKLQGAGYAEILRRIREEEPPRPSARLSDSGEALPLISARRMSEPARLTRLVRRELDWIVMRALEKDRSRRYETAVEFARDVKRYLADEPVEACPPSAPYRLKKFARKNRMLLGSVSSFAALLVLGAAVSTWQAVRATRAEGAALNAEATTRQERDRAVKAEATTRQERDRAVKAEATTRQERDRAVKAEGRARTEASIATAVNDFLQDDLLAEADPAKNPRGAQVTVEAVLGKAATRIGGKFAGQPLVEAAIRRTVGRTYQALGIYSESQTHLERALELRRRVLGSEHPDTLMAAHNLGWLLRLEGRYEKAEDLLAQTLEARRRISGPEDSETLWLANSLAWVYRDQGRYAKAEPLLAHVLKSRRRVLPPEHPDTLMAAHNLGVLYQNQSRYDEAEPLLTQVLERQQRVLGPEHPETLWARQNLGSLYRDQSRYDEAEPLLTQVLEARRRVLGPEHPDTQNAANNLGWLYRLQGRYEKAEPLFTQSLETRRRISGPEHPETLWIANNLGWLYRLQGRYEKAEPLLTQVLEARRRISGPKHPDTLTAAHNLGVLRGDQGRYDEAEPLLTQSLEARRQVLGPEHPETLTAAHNLGVLYRNQSRYNEAEPLLTQVLEDRQHVLGAEHPETLAAFNELGLLYRAQGQYGKAELLLVAVLTAHRHAYGPDDPKTRTAARALDGLRRTARDVSAAELSYRKALERRGAEHSETLSAHRNWGKVLLATGAYAPAGSELQAALDDASRLHGPDNRATLVTRSDLAWLHFQQKKYRQAEEEYRGLLHDDRRALGESDKDTVSVLLNALTFSVIAKRPEFAWELCRSWTGPLDPRAADVLSEHGDAFLTRQDYTAAESFLRLCLSTREKAQPEIWKTFNARSLLGGSLLGQGRFAEAEPLLLSGYDGLKSRQAKISPTSNRHRLTEAGERVVALYEAWGQPLKAAEWRSRLEVDSGRAALPDDVFARP